MREEREKAKMASRFKSKMALKPSKKNVHVTSTTPTVARQEKLKMQHFGKVTRFEQKDS